MTEREVVLFCYKDKQRPAVILRIVGDKALIVYGTGTQREAPCVIVEPESSRGRSFGGIIYKPTYFYASASCWVMNRLLRPLDPPRRCRPDLFLELREIAETSVR